MLDIMLDREIQRFQRPGLTAEDLERLALLRSKPQFWCARCARRIVTVQAWAGHSEVCDG